MKLFPTFEPPKKQNVKVFKFGGASVKDAASVKNVADIINKFGGEQLLVVVSAMGKTTNGLERLAEAYFNRKTEAVQQIYSEIKSFHDEIISDLLKNKTSHDYDDIENLFIELDCLLENEPEGDFDYNYDQIVSYGEVFSTRIVSTYMNQADVKNRWMDARNFISTDDNFREGTLDWELTTSLIEKKLKPIVQKQIVVTQGFIGQTSDKLTTTLGREGSDYSAAIFAYGLDAESVTIWKDVAGVMNADPKKYSDAVKINELGYSHAIEMAYYGATVIHPKTIQPLQSKHIPLYVRSFVNPDAAGTVVSTGVNETKIPTIISKNKQVLLSISSKDFSFIVEDNLSLIFSIFAKHKVRTNLMQNSAISFSVCIDDVGEKIDKLCADLTDNYLIKSSAPVELLTINNYDEETVHKLTSGKEILLEQKTRAVIQLVIK